MPYKRKTKGKNSKTKIPWILFVIQPSLERIIPLLTIELYQKLLTGKLRKYSKYKIQARAISIMPKMNSAFKKFLHEKKLDAFKN